MGDIYITHRNWRDGTWSEPRNLGCAPNGPNLAGMEYGPSLIHTKVGTYLYFSSGDPVGAGTQDIYVSKRGYDLKFRAPTPVAELNTVGYDDFMPNVSRDGREIVFASSRPGGLGASDIYTSTRSWVRAAWCDPVNLGPSVNTVAGESRPSLSGGRHAALLRPEWGHLRQPETGLVDSRTTDAGVPLGHPGVRSCVHRRVQSPGSTRQNGWSTGSR